MHNRAMNENNIAKVWDVFVFGSGTLDTLDCPSLGRTARERRGHIVRRHATTSPRLCR